MCRQSGREKMELRSVIYGWAIWWSIYTCGSPAAYSAACYPDVRRFTARLIVHLTHVSPDTCLTLACGSPLTYNQLRYYVKKDVMDDKSVGTRDDMVARV